MSDVSPAEIQNWLVEYIADQLNVGVKDVSIHSDFVELGLPSRTVISMTDDLGKFVGYAVNPNAAWENPTIARLAKNLRRET